jgi:N-6 DNA Methylase
MFFKQYLLSLGIKDFDGKSNFHRYDIVLKSDNHVNNIPLEFHFVPKTFLFEESIYDIHDNVWNKNDTPNFIIVSEEKSYIFDSKIKPKKGNPFNAEIDSFKHRNSFNNDDNPILKKNLDSGYFFEFVIQKTKKNKQQEVDKDLLLNLIALRQDLLNIKNDESTIHLLILRCLFLRYLEDRGIYEKGYVVSALIKSPDALITAFNEVGRINGDIFKYDVLTADHISPNYLSSIARFFTCDYLTGQGSLFPYKFDCIPVQLISNVYEAFLSDSKKKGKGIYYTPKFVVDFMLSETLKPLLKSNPNITLFDPACGSAAFLVEGFKAIIHRNKAQKDFEKKKQILENQIFGIDIDKDALQIATFSLYLTLLEDLEPDFIRYQIEKQSPILPNLIGKNLLCGNSLTDNELFEDEKFDCIVANPPWGSVLSNETNEIHEVERETIGGKGIVGLNPIYKNVSDYQRSQAFLLRVKFWSSDKTEYCLIVNNAILLNENAEAFRKDLINTYNLKTIYELSDLNPILFRKKTIGEVNGRKIESGATEPCAVIVFNNQNVSSYLSYITPKLNKLSTLLEIIQITQRDVKHINQAKFENDLLWRILVNGDLEDYELIENLIHDNTFTVECRSGFQPKKGMIELGEPDFRPLVKPDDFSAFFIKKELKKFNWNVDLRRKPEGIFDKERILLKVRPTQKNELRLDAVRIQKNEIFQDDVLCIKIKQSDRYIDDYTWALGIINSSLIGFYTYQISAQWGKGDLKRSSIRNSDIETIPLPKIRDNNFKTQISALVAQIENKKIENQNTQDLEKKLDDLVFDLYGLLTFEKEIIREFYDINVHRKNDTVRKVDLEAYFLKFKEVFELALSADLEMKATYKISKNLGAYLCLHIEPKNKDTTELFALSNISDDEVFHAIKSQQLEQAFYSNKLNEITTKVYESERFFIIKSNYFKDWTVRQAIKDANEEIKTFIQETTTID